MTLSSHGENVNLGEKYMYLKDRTDIMKISISCLFDKFHFCKIRGIHQICTLGLLYIYIYIRVFLLLKLKLGRRSRN